jgi:hypothetical protein
MSYPRTFFENNAEAERPGTCFVIMPFADEFDAVHAAVAAAFEAPEVGFRCRRADQLFGGHEIMDGVLRELARAEVIVADLTGRNPNVFYELGIAHMRKAAARVLLMTQRMEDVPFDLRSFNNIVYSPTEEGLAELKRQLSAAALAVAGTEYRFSVASGGAHLASRQFFGTDRCFYSVEIADAMLIPGAAKCFLTVKRHVVRQEPTAVIERAEGLSEGSSVPLYEKLPWRLRLDSATDRAAYFSIISTAKPAPAASAGPKPPAAPRRKAPARSRRRSSIR